jgi:hypothetical protein
VAGRMHRSRCAGSCSILPVQLSLIYATGYANLGEIIAGIWWAFAKCREVHAPRGAISRKAQPKCLLASRRGLHVPSFIFRLCFCETRTFGVFTWKVLRGHSVAFSL